MQIFGKKNVVAAEHGNEPEPQFDLDVTTARHVDRSGWEYWTLYPRRMHLEHDWCGGGPPRRRSTFEFAVRHASVFTRLLERSNEHFNEPEYIVFGGSILLGKIERDYAAKAREYEPGGKWEKTNAAMKETLLSDTPAILAEELQKEIVWHEIYGAVRYFVLSKHATAVENSSFLCGESRRYQAAFVAFDRAVQETGAVWNDKRGWYEAPDGATEDEKDALRKKLRAENFGLMYRGELIDREVILGVLKDAIGK